MTANSLPQDCPTGRPHQAATPSNPARDHPPENA